MTRLTITPLTHTTPNQGNKADSPETERLNEILRRNPDLAMGSVDLDKPRDADATEYIVGQKNKKKTAK